MNELSIDECDTRGHLLLHIMGRRETCNGCIELTLQIVRTLVERENNINIGWLSEEGEVLTECTPIYFAAKFTGNADVARSYIACGAWSRCPRERSIVCICSIWQFSLDSCSLRGSGISGKV